MTRLYFNSGFSLVGMLVILGIMGAGYVTLIRGLQHGSWAIRNVEAKQKFASVVDVISMTLQNPALCAQALRDPVNSSHILKLPLSSGAASESDVSQIDINSNPMVFIGQNYGTFSISKLRLKEIDPTARTAASTTVTRTLASLDLLATRQRTYPTGTLDHRFHLNVDLDSDSTNAIDDGQIVGCSLANPITASVPPVGSVVVPPPPPPPSFDGFSPGILRNFSSNGAVVSYTVPANSVFTLYGASGDYCLLNDILISSETAADDGDNHFIVSPNSFKSKIGVKTGQVLNFRSAGAGAVCRFWGVESPGKQPNVPTGEFWKASAGQSFVVPANRALAILQVDANPLLNAQPIAGIAECRINGSPVYRKVTANDGTRTTLSSGFNGPVVIKAGESLSFSSSGTSGAANDCQFVGVLLD